MNDPFLDFMMTGLAGSVTPPVSPLERDNADIMSQRPEVIKFLTKMQDEVNTFLSTHKVN